MYSVDRKLSAQLVYNHVQSIRKTADILCVSKSSVQRWVVSLISKILASPIKKFQTTKLTLILETVELCLKSDPFLTCKKLKALIKENLGLEVSKELVRLSIVKLSYTRKKARFYGLAKNALKLNRAFLKLRNLFIKQGRGIFSIDETGFGRFSYDRAYGYAMQGKPLFVRKEKPRMTSISVIACASEHGWTGYKSVKGGVNRVVFCDFLKSLNLPHGSVLLLDNASIHRGNAVMKTLEEMGVIPLYVPPYSPWFNPIEKCFSSVKRNFLEKEDVEFAMSNLSQERHFAPYFKKTLECNGFDNEDSLANLAPYEDIEIEIETKKVTKSNERRKNMEKIQPTLEKTETIAKNKTPNGDTVTVRTTTTVLTTTRKKPIRRLNLNESTSLIKANGPQGE